MGIMEKIAAAIDAAKRTAGRNVSDLVQNPGQYVEMLDDRAKNYNANVQPTIQGGELTNRPLTPEEIDQKSTDLAMSVMPMGVGSMASVGSRMHQMGLISGNELKALVGKGAPLKTEAEMLALEKEMLKRKMAAESQLGTTPMQQTR